jgi:hypothetical protein
MKKYKLIVLTGGGFTQQFEVIADTFHTTTNSSTTIGYYAFYLNNEFIASYPIERTLINEVIKLENEESGGEY